MQRTRPLLPSSACNIIALGISMGWFLVVVRAVVLGAACNDLCSLTWIEHHLAGTSSDLAYVASLTAAATGLALALRCHRILGLLLLIFFGAAAVFSLLAALVNIEAVRMNACPFTYSWLLYADFFRSQDGRAALSAACSASALLAVGGQVMAMLLLALLLSWGLRKLCRTPIRLVIAVIAGIVLGGAYCMMAHFYGRQYKLDAGKTANPVVAFAVSLLRTPRLPALFTMRPSAGPDDVQVAAERNPTPSVLTPLPRIANPGQVRNIIVFVMESVAAEYTDPYGAAYGVTPNFLAAASRGILFTNAYAHVPATACSLASILCSIYPPASRCTIPGDYNAASVRSVSDILKARGYRTAFFNAGDLKYLRCGQFLVRHDFDLIEDCNGQPVDQLLTDDTQWGSPVCGFDDVHMVQALNRWIGTATSQSPPFFAVAWTINTHYPYQVCGQPKEIVDSSDTRGQMLNSYLNALGRSDEALGDVMRFLDKHNLAQSTLVVVVGDHGEAFGRHSHYGHAGAIYEENVHVPLLLINPGLFHGQSNLAVAGLVDLAPTLLHLLNQDSSIPGSWQGRSLFDPQRCGRVYFQCLTNDYLFGCRDGSKTFIFNGTTGVDEIYDVVADPLQLHDIAGGQPALIDAIHNRMAAWVQYQVRLIKSISDGHKS